jgi:hypothetical protein
LQLDELLHPGRDDIYRRRKSRIHVVSTHSLTAVSGHPAASSASFVTSCPNTASTGAADR